MKALLTTGAVLLLVAGSAGAEAATSAAVTPPAAATQPMSGTMSGSMSIRQQIQTALGKDGYTDVSVMPSAFLVHAKNKQGQPVAMVIGPDSMTEVMEIPAPIGQGASAAAPATPQPAK